jgi:hypothetical protein
MVEGFTKFVSASRFELSRIPADYIDILLLMRLRPSSWLASRIMEEEKYKLTGGHPSIIAPTEAQWDSP